jgi:hypothetical protein
MLLMGDLDRGGGENDLTTSFTKLADGEQRMGCKTGDDVDLAGQERLVGKIKLGSVGRVHDVIIGVVNYERMECGVLVDNWQFGGAKMGCTAAVGYYRRVDRRGGRTGWLGLRSVATNGYTMWQTIC